MLITPMIKSSCGKALEHAARATAKPLSWLGSTSPATWLAGKYKQDPVKFVSWVSLSSVVLKDALGCCLYVYQSLNNKKIPEKKRKFVASLDLTNGGMMIATQVLTFCTISNKKVQDWMFNTFLGRFFKDSNRRKIKQSAKRSTLGASINRSEAFEKALKNAEQTTRNALKIFVPLIGATIFAKRVIVPFLATPMATWANKHVFHGDDDMPKTDVKNNILQQTSLKNIFDNIAKIYSQHQKQKN